MLGQVAAIEASQEDIFDASVCATNIEELTHQLRLRERHMKTQSIAYHIHVCATILAYCLKDVCFIDVVRGLWTYVVSAWQAYIR